MTHNSKLWTRFETHLHNEGLTEVRRRKLKTMFLVVERGLDLERADKAAIEEFVGRLNRGTFKRKNGKPYSGSSKSDIQKFLKQFYRWYRGDGEFYPKEVSWIKARINKDERPKEKPVVTEAEVRKLAAQFTNTADQIQVLLLFDSGFRANEMRSVEKQDLELRKVEGMGDAWFLTCRKSKTYPRTVDVELFHEDLTLFANSAYYQSLKPGDKLFTTGKSSFYKGIVYHSQKLFGPKRRITEHALRHSSASLYAGIYQGDRVKLAERYGWSYSAKELDTYVRRYSHRQRESVKIVVANELDKLRAQLEELRRAREEDRAEFQAFVKALGLDQGGIRVKQLGPIKSITTSKKKG